MSEREFSQLPEAGDNIRLTLDVDLQRAAEEALAFGIRLAHDQGEWAADGGAIVAMDVDTGEVLALASNPTFDPDVYVGRIEEKELRAARGQERQPPDPQPRGGGRLSAGLDLQAVRRPRRSAGGPAPARTRSSSARARRSSTARPS